MTAEVQDHGLTVLARATTVVVLFQVLLILTDIAGQGDSNPDIVAVLAATAVLFGVNRRLREASGEEPVSGWVLAWRSGTLVLLAAITLVIALDRYSLAPDLSPHLFSMMLWAVVGLKGAAVGKLRPGGPLGLRVPWTLKSRLAWERAHRHLGRILFLGGLIGLAASPFLPFLVSFAALGALILTAAGSALYESWQTWKVDPDAIA